MQFAPLSLGVCRIMGESDNFNMPKPKKPTTPQEPEENALVSAAKAIGTAAGKVASLAGVAPHAEPTPKGKKVGKLLKKDGKRLPRRQKKAAQKAANQGTK
jgi:hypothetical protein